MMKLGEAANRLSRLGVLAPDGIEWAIAVANRNFLIHQYDELNPRPDLADAVVGPARVERVAAESARGRRGLD